MKAVADSFVQRINETEQAIQLLPKLRQLGALKTTRTTSRTRLGRTASDLQTSLRMNREWETLTLDGSILIIAAQFELAIRDMAESFVSVISGKVKKYEELPRELREENVRLIGRLLQDTQRPQFAHVDYVQIVQELSMCVSKGKPVRLFGTGFTFHERNMTSNEVAQVFHRVRIKDLWRGVATDSALQTHIGTRAVDATAELTKKKLDGFMQQRNQIAHRGPSYQSVGETIVLDYIAFFRSLVPAIGNVIESSAVSFP